ncbi:uncharacterized protein ACLA_084200 [Aspergillus clavatus NRRL 1]|uniref:ORC6 first cyclin-like domain-containing protein n=1 Tax=Aspergillus clavatus (strain ATCC 1007 / CBS 513.65 / DSM 816 / NCTC 3887 / NRRL 1 / QM 1276 / 107) TaxID=344612 RepID=A1CTT8_ASPCL|nr:uncharacterized protein ACLA_084200 [Aspergillus clavatus NRRL 1]EAW06725.1 conserved hypothetical protein [Aspergillus clavatus NRRL 1]
MNNRPVEQALSTLVPTHANDLPPELVSLALSLVAQSRSFATSLRPEEEIARPYACAEIACRRLSRTLKLPPLLGHPPCPPRAYKKLYSFLERSLSASTTSNRSGETSTPGTPSRSGLIPSTPTKTRTPAKAAPTPRGLQNTPSKSTPLKRAISASAKPASTLRTPQRTYTRPNGLSASTDIPDAPAWVMTSIRTMCKTLSTPAPRTTTWSRPPISRTLPPHIYAGVSSILYLISSLSVKNDDDLDEEMMEFLEPIISTRNANKDEDFKEVVYALIVAIYFIVLARRRTAVDDGSGEAGEAGEAKKMDKKTFSEMRQTALVSLGLPSTERRHRDDVDQWIALIMEQNWMNGQEWFENIPLAGELDGDEEYLSDSYGERGDEDAAQGRKRAKTTGAGRGFSLEDSSKRKGLLPGLGTMMQDRVDWLSEDRREDYVEWKADMMAQIGQMEKAAQLC